MTLTQYLIIGAGVVGAAIIALLSVLIGIATKQAKKAASIAKAAVSPALEELKQVKSDLADTQKAIILGQSRDAESRKALIELLTEKKKEVLAPIAEAVKEEIKQEEKAIKRVTEKVQGKYTPVD